MFAFWNYFQIEYNNKKLLNNNKLKQKRKSAKKTVVMLNKTVKTSTKMTIVTTEEDENVTSDGIFHEEVINNFANINNTHAQAKDNVELDTNLDKKLNHEDTNMSTEAPTKK